MAKIPALVIGASLVVSPSLLAQPAAAEEAAHRPGMQEASLPAVPGNDRPVALSELDWMAGPWLLEREGERLEEYWDPPLDDERRVSIGRAAPAGASVCSVLSPCSF